jgi:hypothetical protein
MRASNGKITKKDIPFSIKEFISILLELRKDVLEIF